MKCFGFFCMKIFHTTCRVREFSFAVTQFRMTFHLFKPKVILDMCSGTMLLLKIHLVYRKKNFYLVLLAFLLEYFFSFYKVR